MKMFEKPIPIQMVFRGWRRRWRRVMINKMIIKFTGIPNKAQMSWPHAENVSMKPDGSLEPVAISDVLITMLFTSISRFDNCFFLVFGYLLVEIWLHVTHSILLHLLCSEEIWLAMLGKQKFNASAPLFQWCTCDAVALFSPSLHFYIDSFKQNRRLGRFVTINVPVTSVTAVHRVLRQRLRSVQQWCLLNLKM